MGDRVEWLRAAMRGTWTELGERYTSFRDGVVAAVAACPHDTVVFSHFVAINAVIGACVDDERLVIRSLDNCSVTTVAIDERGVRLVEGGHEADTLIR
jgi:broad specificity phosphatase PhoE